MTRIKADNPIVELDGDEMARVVWRWTKEELILPYVDIAIEYYDLSLPNRDATDDRVTKEGAAAVKRARVGLKCAAIAPDRARVKEFALKKAWPSPTPQVRNAVGGTLFRQPIICRNVPRRIPHWTKPIFVARHAFGDQFAATDFYVPGEGTLTLRFEPKGGGEPIERIVHEFPGPGIAMGMYNHDASIRGFALSCMRFALEQRCPLYLGTKNTVVKVYDQRFKDIFDEVYREDFARDFEAAGLFYEHRIVDELAAFAIKSDGGFVYACKNHDGDVQADMVAEGFGSLGLMTGVLLTPDGRTVVTEAAHGTITRHYREHQAGRETSTNPVASIFAWTRALAYRARFDGSRPLADFADRLEAATIETVEAGAMTKDLAQLAGTQSFLTTRQFLAKVKDALERKLG